MVGQTWGILTVQSIRGAVRLEFRLQKCNKYADFPSSWHGMMILWNCTYYSPRWSIIAGYRTRAKYRQELKWEIRRDSVCAKYRRAGRFEFCVLHTHTLTATHQHVQLKASFSSLPLPHDSLHHGGNPCAQNEWKEWAEGVSEAVAQNPSSWWHSPVYSLIGK